MDHNEILDEFNNCYHIVNFELEAGVNVEIYFLNFLLRKLDGSL